jgi:hypothetical protein
MGNSHRFHIRLVMADGRREIKGCMSDRHDSFTSYNPQ